MVESTRQNNDPLADPQEEIKDDMVAYLRNKIQMVENSFNEEMNAIDRQLYTLRKMMNRLMEDKSDPMISQDYILKKIEKKQAEIEPWIAAANNLRLIRDEFKFETESLCEKTEIRLKSKDEKPKVVDSNLDKLEI